MRKSRWDQVGPEPTPREKFILEKKRVIKIHVTTTIIIPNPTPNKVSSKTLPLKGKKIWIRAWIFKKKLQLKPLILLLAGIRQRKMEIYIGIMGKYPNHMHKLKSCPLS